MCNKQLAVSGGPPVSACRALPQDTLTPSGLLPPLQSAYRAFHMTETAVLTDILLAIDTGDLSALALLDVSAAFDMVDHEFLIHQLRTSYHLSGLVIQ